MPSPDWKKLEVQLGDIDVPRLLAAWRWLVDEPVQPFALTRFGDWFVSDAHGAVHRIDALEGTFAPVCSSLSVFSERRERDDELADWYQDGTVHAAYSAGLMPGPGEGFGYRLPPILGGSTEVHNVVIVDVASWQFFMSQLHEKLRSVPAGARVEE
jgi:hypothetical protein